MMKIEGLGVVAVVRECVGRRALYGGGGDNVTTVGWWGGGIPVLGLIGVEILRNHEHLS